MNKPFNHNFGKGKIVSWLLSMLLCILCVSGYSTKIYASTGSGTFGNKTAESSTSSDNEDKEQLQITMLNVGQGLSVLLELDGYSMIYDGGGRESSSYVVACLEQAGITKLDLMVASHYDEDHIAGLIGCLHNYKVDKLICPDYITDTDIFASFSQAAWLNGAPVERPAVGTTYSLGEAQISVLGPEEYSVSQENDSSIVLRVDYGEFSCLLTGDAEAAEEQFMLENPENLDVDLLVLGHHGSKNSSGPEFLEAVSPEMVWISCGMENTFGHPAAETMENLKEMGIELYRSDLQGEVSCVTDGVNRQLNVEACEDYSCGSDVIIPLAEPNAEKVEETTVAERSVPETVKETAKQTQEYVLNKNTKKFHYPNCKSVKQMKEKNKKYVDSDRDSLVAQGYSPCGNCHP